MLRKGHSCLLKGSPFQLGTNRTILMVQSALNQPQSSISVQTLALSIKEKYVY